MNEMTPEKLGEWILGMVEVDLQQNKTAEELASWFDVLAPLYPDPGGEGAPFPRHPLSTVAWEMAYRAKAEELGLLEFYERALHLYQEKWLSAERQDSRSLSEVVELWLSVSKLSQSPQGGIHNGTLVAIFPPGTFDPEMAPDALRALHKGEASTEDDTESPEA